MCLPFHPIILFETKLVKTTEEIFHFVSSLINSKILFALPSIEYSL